MNRKSRSVGRRSSILKIDLDKEVEKEVTKNVKRASRRVSFAETYQVKEFPRDSPHVWNTPSTDAEDSGEGSNSSRPTTSKHAYTITGLDQLLTGAIQSPLTQDAADVTDTIAEMFQTVQSQSADALQPMQLYSAKTENQASCVGNQASCVGNQASCIFPGISTSTEAGNIDEEARSFIPSPLSLDQDAHFHPHDKENVFPSQLIAASDALGNGSGNSEENLVDVKSFLSKMFGGGSSAAFMEKCNEAEDNDKTRLGSEDMDETTCVGGDMSIVGERQCPEESNIQAVHSEGYHVTNTLKENALTLLNDSGEDFEMEETKCIGGMLTNTNIGEMFYAKSKSSDRNSQEINEEYGFTSDDIQGSDANGVELTKCVGGIVYNNDNKETSVSTFNASVVKNVLENEDQFAEKTVHFDVPQDMEETKCVTGILKNFRAELTSTANITINANETNEDRYDIGSEGNLRCSIKKATENAGVDSVVTSEVIHTDKEMQGSVAAHLGPRLEGETSHVAAQLGPRLEGDTSHGQRPDLNTTQSLEKTVYFDGVGAEWNAGDLKDEKCVKRHEAQSTELFSEGAEMDMTEAVGTILVQDNVDAVNRFDTCSENSKLDKNERENFTTNDLVDMEETACLTGLHVERENFTTNDLVGMEETACLTGILEDNRNLSNVHETNNKIVIETNTNVATAEDRSMQVHAMNQLNEVTSSEREKNAMNSTVLFSSMSGLLDNKKPDLTVCEPADMDITAGVDGMLSTESDKSSNKVTDKNGQNESDEKVHNFTTVGTVNMEETECLGIIHNAKLATVQSSGTTISKTDEALKVYEEESLNKSLEKYDNAHNFTSVGTVAIEETECIGGILDDVQKANDENMEDFTRGAADNHCEVSADNHGDNNEVVYVDEEITLNISKKPAHEEDKVNSDEIRTMEHTQTQAKLQKLREMLIKSKSSVVDQIKKGEMKTPSKPVYNVGKQSDLNRSRTLDVHGTSSLSPCSSKKPKFDGDTVEGTSLLLAGYNDSYHGSNDGYQAMGTPDKPGELQEEDLKSGTGIDDEPMPEIMADSEWTFSEPEPMAAASVCSSDGGNTTGRGVISSSSSSNISSINMSMNLTNKSFASSFIDPKMPLSLEDFYKLTYRPPKAFPTGRCSVAFPPVIDMDDIGEVLRAKVTMTPLVHAKKAAKERFTQMINRDGEEIRQLEQNLEEMQPQIFRDCVSALPKQRMEITSKLMELSSTCHKMVQTQWKQGTKDMYAEALHDVQTTGIEQAEALVNEVRAANNTMDQLLCVLDCDIEEFVESAKGLKELQGKQLELNKEIELGQAELDKLQDQQSQLTSKVGYQDSISSQREELKMKIKYHLLCAEWDLEEYEEDYVVFTFFNGDFVMKIDFTDVEGKKTVDAISFNNQRGSREDLWVYERVRHEFVLAALDVESLKSDFPDFNHLPKMMSQVSRTMMEISRFTNDVRDVEFKKTLVYTNQTITVRMWDLETVNMIDLHFKFDPHLPLSTEADVNVTVILGTLTPASIQTRLRAVKPGLEYFSRLLQAVDFSQLHK